jgi:DNA-binding NarL/FixJ family response regulator
MGLQSATKVPSGGLGGIRAHPRIPLGASPDNRKVLACKDHASNVAESESRSGSIRSERRRSVRRTAVTSLSSRKDERSDVPAPSGHPSKPHRLRVVVADDSALIRDGIARLLSEKEFDVVSKVSDADVLVDRVRELSPDLVVTDIRMPPTNTNDGLLAAQRIRQERPTTGVLVLSQYVETQQAMKLFGERPRGVGYLLKDRIRHIEEFIEALERIAAGGFVVDPDVVGNLLQRRRTTDELDKLTEREREILGLMAQGRSNLAIGRRLFLSPKTVENHIAHIFTKLGLEQTPDDHRRVLAVLTYLRSL